MTSTFLVSTDRRLRAYLIGGLLALMVVAGSVAYEVKSGDTLSAIAAAHGVSLQALLDSNGDISDPDFILPGQEIVIPGQDGAPARIHVVAAGETLGVIANRYEAAVSDIASANELSDPNLVRIGQKLKIPARSGDSDDDAANGTSFHVVEAGETLASIAARYGVPVSQLAQANGITDPSRIYVGTRLALSGDSFVAEAADSGSSVGSHTVASGETLGSIARQYGVGTDDLARANDIVDVNRIRVGQTLTIPGSGWVCPVSGATYVNDWGFPRSDGRFHQGTDLFAPRGTEVVAPVGGEIKLITGTVGGLQFFLHGDDGVTYVGTHLDAFGRSGRVEAGQVIGYVGDTGNARGGPTHLHFEVHPGDGEAVNPFPTLQQAGC
ncbi:MAG TPA: LysM peptidoglycan-binding domain-containing protein [Acidimicrobiia bacterium]|nr:LysM peptidoglycan-binding domain-containing protein [Acidimicrobiia bacterium]